MRARGFSLTVYDVEYMDAFRNADADTLIVADSTSCRHQIADGTGREALHAARVLAMALGD